MSRLTVLIVLFSASAAVAQTPAPPAAPPTPDVVTGSFSSGVQAVDNSTDSSKLTEYRDLQNNLFLPSLSFGISNRATGRFLDVRGVNLTRSDQSLFATVGQLGRWRAVADWVETPHNFSNQAVTPYINRGGGLLTVPATIPIAFKKLATVAGDEAGVLSSDALIAAYQATFLAPTALAMHTNTGRFLTEWTAGDGVSLRFAYDKRDKYGSRASFGPIGDRPPRTLNIALAEPVDYNTNELSVTAEHEGAGYQVRAEYQFSDFANQIDTLQWQNIYVTAAPGATFDAWDRSVSAFGVRPLSPDNRAHHVTGTFGGNLPRDSRITATATYGRLEQNATLLPYSYNVDQLAVKTLPRSTAEGAINTLHLAADYTITPFPRLNLRAFVRSYSLTNDTPSSRWQYVTSDTSNLNGTVSYVNKRVSLPYAWDRRNAGVDATWRLPARTSLVVGVEREEVDREFREADTAENVVRAALRTRGSRRATVELRGLLGIRDGGTYNNAVTHEGYWYSQSDGVDNNNPALTFDNHPDMRRFDVSDRLRRQIDARINITPRDALALSAYARYRKDDYDSDVVSSQPLLNTALADRAAASPGDQLGRLKDARARVGIDAYTEVRDGLSFNAFVNVDKGTGLDRSMEFNENNKANPSAIATAELGPWTRATNQWTAEYDDRTWSAGGGLVWQVPGKATVTADYLTSIARIDIAYGGFGLTSFDGTPFAPNHQFAFSSPPTVTEDLQMVNLRLELPVGAMSVVVGYTFEHYGLDDWMQGATSPWVEAVGADTLLRDTSRSFQWGNRLFNLGTYLAPSYDAHIGFVGLRYRF